MQRIKILPFVICLVMAHVSFAKGHGGHGGAHHGGGHHGGGGHSSGGHSSGGHSSGRYSSGGHSSARSAAGKSATRTTAKRGVPAGRSVNTIGAPTRTLRTRPVTAGRGYIPVVTNGYYRHEYYPYYYYGYYPYFNYPYFSMWSVGMFYMNTPNYGYYPPAPGNSYGGGGYSKNNEEEGDNGYAVYARDTIRGRVTLKPNAVLLETSDSGRNYDYKFKIKHRELTCVTIYNDDNKQLDLVRLKAQHKKLWRVVHTGKLNIYDEHPDFIYTPDDIDIRSLVVVYNGETISLRSSSVNEIKERLTELVNKAYGANLDAKKFSWNELLVYIDKLN